MAKKTHLDPKNIVWIQDNNVSSTNDSFCKTCPVTHKRLEPRTTTVEMPISLNCGEDEICDSDLVVSTKFIELE